MAEECSVLSNEQTFPNKLNKYYNILNKIKTGEKENKVDYYYIQR